MKKIIGMTVLVMFLISSGAFAAPKQPNRPPDVSWLIAKIEAKKEVLSLLNEKIKTEREADMQAMKKQREEKLQKLEKTDPERAKLIRDKIALQERESKLDNGKKTGKKNKGNRAEAMSMLKARNPSLAALMEERAEMMMQIKGLNEAKKQALRGGGQKNKGKGNNKNKGNKKNKQREQED